MATSTAPHLDQLEAADRLRDHVFTLVRAGEMNAALILIRADVHSAALALAAESERNLRVVPVDVTERDPGQEEPDNAEDAPTEDAPTEDAPTEDAPTEDAPTEDGDEDGDEDAPATTAPAQQELASV